MKNNDMGFELIKSSCDYNTYYKGEMNSDKDICDNIDESKELPDMNLFLSQNRIRIGKRLMELLNEDCSDKYLNLDKTGIYSKLKVSSCPCCGDKNIIKHGFFNGVQRYRCKKCKHTFSNSSNSILKYSKKHPSLWNAFVKMVFEQDTLRECSRKLGISLVTAFQWRHKILFALGSLNKVTEFKGDVHMEAATFVANNKGNYTKNKPKYVREKNRLFRYICSDKIEVIGVHSEDNQIILSPNKFIPYGHCIRTNIEHKFDREIAPKIPQNTYIKAYRSKNLINFAIKHDNKLPKNIKEEKGYKDKIIHKIISICFSMEDKICEDEIIKNLKFSVKKFLYCYMGVATKYLQQYFNLVINFITALFAKKLSFGSICEGLFRYGEYIRSEDIFKIDVI